MVPFWSQRQDPIRPTTLARAGDRQLGCWCNAEPCHAEVVQNAIVWLVSQANA